MDWPSSEVDPPTLRVVYSEALAFIDDLRRCPICGWTLVTLFKIERIVAKECANHGEVFIIHPSINGYEIKVNLTDEPSTP